MKVPMMPTSYECGPYAEGDEGGHVEDGDGAEGPRAPVDLLDDHQLPDVQEDGVELQDHADRRAPDVLPRVQAEIITTCSRADHSLVLSSHPTSKRRTFRAGASSIRQKGRMHNTANPNSSFGCFGRVSGKEQGNHATWEALPGIRS